MSSFLMNKLDIFTAFVEIKKQITIVKTNTMGTIIIAFIFIALWIFIILEIYNAKEFSELYGYKEDENNNSKSNKL